MIVTIVPIAAVELSKKLSAMTFVFFKGKKIILNKFHLPKQTRSTIIERLNNLFLSVFLTLFESIEY